MAKDGQQMDEALVARAVRVFRWVGLLEFAFFVTFVVGGFLLVNTFGKQSTASCVLNAGSSLMPTCSTLSTYLLPIVLLAAGFLGMMLTMFVAAQWAMRTIGVGAMAFLRRRRMMGSGAGMAGAGMEGQPMWPGGMPPGGMPPGTPGSPTGPPLP